VLRPFASLAKLGSAVGIKGIAESPSLPYVAVVVALLLKDRAAVLSGLDRARSAFCSQPDEVCDQFLEFEARVLKRGAQSPVDLFRGRLWLSLCTRGTRVSIHPGNAYRVRPRV
jgi:hypothetical protein